MCIRDRDYRAWVEIDPQALTHNIQVLKHWIGPRVHLLAVVTHLATTSDTTLGAWVYLTAGIIWAYLVAMAVAYGAWTHRPRQPVVADGATRP